MAKVFTWFGLSLVVFLGVVMVVLPDTRTPEEKAAAKASAQKYYADQQAAAEAETKRKAEAESERLARREARLKQPFSGDRATVVRIYAGCSEEERIKELIEIGGSGDAEAWRKAVFESVSMDHCSLFSPGDVVTVADVAVWDGLAKVRRKGDPRAWWLPRAAVEKIQ